MYSLKDTYKFLFIGEIIIPCFSQEVNLLAPRRVLVPEQVGVAEKEKARRLALLQPVFYCNARCGKHPFNSSAKISV